jgi:hypothetical protein
MAEKKRQTFANHARLDLLVHFFALLVFGLAMIGGLIHLIWAPELAFGRLLCDLSRCGGCPLKKPAVSPQGSGSRNTPRRAALDGYTSSRAVALADSGIYRTTTDRVTFRLRCGTPHPGGPGTFLKTFPRLTLRRRFKFGVPTTGACDGAKSLEFVCPGRI